MAKVSIFGTEKMEAMLKDLQKKSEPIIKAGIYDGAKVMADAVKRQIDRSAPMGRQNMKPEGVRSRKKG